MKGQAVVSTMLFLIMMVCQANAEDCSDLNQGNANMTEIEKLCYDSVLWAKETGCSAHPDWYEDEGIKSCTNGTILDFQCALWKMRGKRNDGISHNCTRPCQSPLCADEALKEDEVKEQHESEESGFPIWAIALLVLAVASICGIVAFFWCRGGDGEKKKKKRGIAKEKEKKRGLVGAADVEENTETQALAPPESPAVSAAPALSAQPIIVHHTLPQVGSGSFVAQAMPVAMAHPVMTHSFPVPSFTSLPAATEPVVTQAHPIAHAYATTGVATHMVTPVGTASVTPVPAISTPVAYYQHQGQGSVFQQ